MVGSPKASGGEHVQLTAKPAENPGSEKRARASYTVKRKNESIEAYKAALALNPRVTFTHVAKQGFNIDKTVARKWWIKRDEIRAALLQKPGNKDLTRIYHTKLEIVEEALYRAIKDDIAIGVTVNTSRAKELAYYFYIRWLYRKAPCTGMTVAPDFKFSSGWLTRFMFRYKLKMRVGRGQMGDVDIEANRPAFEAIARQLSDYAPSDIYNCDETGLYLKVMSNRSLSEGRIAGRKPDKDARVSILLCCNADGSDKRKPYVLSKYRPQDLDLGVEAQLDVSYRGTGYMTSDLFMEWMVNFDNDMNGRRVVMLMDNAPGHGKEDVMDRHLRNTTIIRLPPGTTSVAQPLDAGIIMSFKVKYSRLMIPIVSECRSAQKTHKARVPKGPLWACLPVAWNRVSVSAIRNCFARVPVLPDAMRETLRADAIAASEAPDIELLELKAELLQLYPDLSSTIESQTDFGVLAFLKSMSRRGPTIPVDKYLDELALLPKYKPFILPRPDSDDERHSDLDDDLSDDDFWYQPPPAHTPPPPSPPASPEVRPSKRIMIRRTGSYNIDLPPDAPSSPEAASSHEATSSQEPASSQDAMSSQGAKTVATEPESTIQALGRLVVKYSKDRDTNVKILDDNEQVMVDEMEKDILFKMDMLYDIVYCAKDRRL